MDLETLLGLVYTDFEYFSAYFLFLLNSLRAFHFPANISN